MGGKALNQYGVFTERKNTEEFNQIGLEISQRIYIDLKLVTSVVKCYHTKADHGDLDLLIKMPFTYRTYKTIVDNINWKDYILKTFAPQAVNCNGGVYSFDYENFQIDFIPIPESKWDTALVYFSYDPCGNICGKTYHKFGLSYGWEGLFYKFRNSHGSNHSDILISNDIRKIFEFGGYDYDRYLKGFDTLQDIFKFCIDGKYFDVDMFKFENLKHIDKKRNRKRVSYHVFLKYLEDNNINTVYNFEKDKNSYLPMIADFFKETEFIQEVEKLKEADRINKLVSEKFNGNIVMTWIPNLNGKELGAIIGKFKNAIGEQYNEFILNSNYDKIKDFFMYVYDEYRTK
jgi:hypothetical protein